jgi:inosose dehydratase
MTAPSAPTGLRIGTAPDSWGVWFADDPRQTPWQRFLDEVVTAGYVWIELGPYGYLPTDPGRLRDELAARGLKLSAGTVFTEFHRGGDAWDVGLERAMRVASLAADLGARHLVVIPGGWRSDRTTEVIEGRTLDDEQWRRLGEGHDRLGRALLETYGVAQQFHSHADTHVGTAREVERLLAATDPRYTNLCLDTGHYAYYGGDALELIRRHPSRIGYLHLKQVDLGQLFDVLKNDVPFATAVAQGITPEPPSGSPPFAPIIEAVADIDPQIFGIVEQDQYPVDPEVPLPIARRTLQHIFATTTRARVD